MPAAAVIPALRAYIKVVAFKTPVVEIAWSGVQRGGTGRREREKEMRYACSSALREKKGKEGGKERKRVHLFTSAFKFSTNFPLSGTSLSRGVTGV